MLEVRLIVRRTYDAAQYATPTSTVSYRDREGVL
jgi:hypothetical protein